jgi:hypothetical protein
MSSTTINLSAPKVSLADLRQIIPAIGVTNTVLVLSSPGMGKTSLLKAFEEDYGKKYHYVYLDGPNLDVGDVAMRIPVHAEEKIKQYLTDLIPMDGKPVMIMVDEGGKIPKIMQPMMTRMYLERTVGDKKLPEGSIVFITSNHTGDGVGDIFPSHTLNRMTVVELRNATNREWAAWATANNVHPMIRAWAMMNPRAFASYRDGGQEENAVIFNPRRTGQFVSLRSLTKCDPIVRNKDKFGGEVTTALLAGTVGLTAGKSMMTFFDVTDQISSTDDVIKDPDNAKIPESPAAMYMMIFNAVDAIETQTELTQFMKFIKRTNSREVQSTFYFQLLENKRTAKIANANAEISAWLQANYKVLI